MHLETLIFALAVTAGDDPRAPRERELAAFVSETRMQARVRDLVALGARMGGTNSGAKAAEYHAKTLRDAGLDVRTIDGPERWCHEETQFSLVAERLGEKPETLKLERAWPYGFSPSAKGGAELSLDARDGCAWITATRVRQSPGAKCAVILNDGSTTRDGEYPVVQHLQSGADNAQPVFGISKREGETLRAWLASGAKVRIQFELVSRIQKARARTVVARLPAANTKPDAAANAKAAWTDDYLLFCAHGDSDSGGPGADDNASGDAVVDEIAIAWSKAIAEKKCSPPAREVRFAIWGSEIFSTQDYLEKHGSGEGTLLGVVNYDQAGFGSGADQVNIEPDDLAPNAELVKILLAVLEAHRGEKEFPAMWATNKSLGGTDSYVFSDDAKFRAASRPALTLYTSAWGEPAEHPRTPGMRGESWRERDQVSVDWDNYYHSAGDTAANTTDKEPWNMGWCARLGWFACDRWLEQTK